MKTVNMQTSNWDFFDPEDDLEFVSSDLEEVSDTDMLDVIRKLQKVLASREQPEFLDEFKRILNSKGIVMYYD